MIEIGTLFQGIILVAWTAQFGASFWSMAGLGFALFACGAVLAGLTYDLFKKLWAFAWPFLFVLLGALIAIYNQEIKALFEVVKPLLGKNF